MKQLLFASLLFVCCVAQAEIIAPNADDSQKCGDKIKTKEVMVLDLEPFGEDQEAAKRFVDKHAGNHFIASVAPEEIQTVSKSIFYTRKSGIKRAAKEAAKRGCDLVLVLGAKTQIVGQTSIANTWGNASTYGSSNTSGSGYGSCYGNSCSGNSSSRTTGSAYTSGHSSTVGTTNNVNKGVALVLMGDRIKGQPVGYANQPTSNSNQPTTDSNLNRLFGVYVSDSTGMPGATIDNVNEGSPSFNASIQPGDILISIDGYKVRNAEHALDLMTTLDFSLKSSIVVVMRDQKERNFLVEFK